MNSHITAYACSHVGNVRTNNEDNIFVNGYCLNKKSTKKGRLYRSRSSNYRQLYSVCDGMGGQAAGEDASEIGVNMMRLLLQRLNMLDEPEAESVREEINRYTEDANRAVVDLPTDSGSTLTVLCIYGDRATVAWLGDSRVYLLRANKLIQLTEDHTEAERMKKMGINPADKRASNSLTRYLGLDIPGLVARPSYADEIGLKKGDVFLLCSDGVSNMVSDDELKTILVKSLDPARKIIEAALKAGGTDNATAVVIDVERINKPLFGNIGKGNKR